MKWPAVNISTPERWARVIVGVAALALAVALLADGAGSLQAILAALLGLCGLDLAVTGALGHCPLYQRLGHAPRSLREMRS
jgi:hypothetical protein